VQRANRGAENHRGIRERMLSGNTIEVVEAAPAWARGNNDTAHDWTQIDRALRSIARRRAALDADEARWLREAEAQQIWKPLGMVSAIDYMERVLGYAPRTAQERLRVARALGALPVLTDALARGALSFSAVRELTRVATPATETDWADAAHGKNLREIEELVATRRPGDRPTDPGDPEVRMHVLRVELTAATYAALRQARVVLEDELGRHLTDDELLALLSHRALEGDRTTEPSGRAKYQIAIDRCDTCRKAVQHGAGAKLAISPAAADRAECDAQRIEHGRAKQDVPPATVRAIWRRDGSRCRVPGCRSARGLEIHHLVHREHGGSHDPSNLILICSSCHQAHHDGRLNISGTADALEVSRPGAHVGAIDDARAALVQLGWKLPIARRAVDAAVHDLGADAELVPLIRRALQHCGSPRS
jgi:5-methylcytosine-specific restriction endonuclease McrA